MARFFSGWFKKHPVRKIHQMLKYFALEIKVKHKGIKEVNHAIWGRFFKSSKYFEKTTRKKKEFKIFSFTENILSNICIPERNSGYFSFNTPCLDAFIHLGLCGQNVLIQNIKREAFVPATVQCFFSQSNLKTCQFVSTFNVCIQVGEKYN